VNITALIADDEEAPRAQLLSALRTVWPELNIIVNQRHIASVVRIDEGNMIVTLRGRPDKLPVSRHFQALFKGQ